jgi:hypothetical protein
LTDANWLTDTTIDAVTNQIGHGTVGVDPVLCVRRIKLESTETQTGIRINCSHAFALFTADISVANDPIQVEGLHDSNHTKSGIDYDIIDIIIGNGRYRSG